jgi:hypothetical protein
MNITNNKDHKVKIKNNTYDLVVKTIQKIFNKINEEYDL